MRALKSAWSKQMEGRTKSTQSPGAEFAEKERLVVAHFMLGNTYPFKETDWETTFDLAEETALDGFALNLGYESWQFDQALAGFTVLENRSGPSHETTRPFRMFLSLDMNVLPGTTLAEAVALIRRTAELMRRPRYLTYKGTKVLSTFGGHDKSLGGWGWDGFLDRLRKEIGEDIMFIPAFFLPPNDILRLPYVDGCFPWNNAWLLGNRANDLKEDQPFLQSGKVHMAAVSPLFFTHYGTTGQWPFNKWAKYPSDDLLMPTRFSRLIDLPPDRLPDIVQVISWNDHGESHAIAPVLGAEPGSEAWTRGMDHIAFREIVKYYATVWRDRSAPVFKDEIKVWMWYRLHPACALATKDEVGRPDHADWAADLINVLILVPSNMRDMQITIRNTDTVHLHSLRSGRPEMFTVPFVPGPVSFEVTGSTGSLLKGEGRHIEAEIERYNFNMWSGSWSVDV